MLLSLEKRFIFIHIPKTAGTSITQALEPYSVHPRRTQFRRLLSHLPVPEAPEKAWLRAHEKAAWVRLKLPHEIFFTFHKFAVVRNPFDYAVSYYFYLRKNPTSRRHAFAHETSFGDFLRYLESKNRIHGVTQTSYVTDRQGRLMVDELLHFERLDVEMPDLLRRLGIDDIALPHVNVSERGDYRTYYGPDDRKLAERLFARDLELFGYSF